MKRLLVTPSYTLFQRLPPKEFDKPYTGWGDLIVRRVAQDEIREACPNAAGTSRRPLLGCALPPRTDGKGGDCFIYIVDDETLVKQRMDYDTVYRHERAHCNGWWHWWPAE
jgi:hypothetical protein